MPKIKVEVEVSKEVHELGEGLKNFIAALKVALADGWQTDQDLPVLLASAMADLIPALQGIEKLPDEAKEDLESFLTGIGLSVKGIVMMLLKK